MANSPAVNGAIASLAAYALEKGLIAGCEYTWAVNSILDALGLDGWEDPGPAGGEIDLAAVLDTLLDDAHARGVLAEDSVVYRDLMDSELMGRLTPRPAQVIEKFNALYEKSPEAATDWYYAFSQDTNYIRRFRRREFAPGGSINEAITHTCCLTAMELSAAAILTPTQSGHTARMISRFRPQCPIVALTTTERARRQLAISWGVTPILAGYVDSTDRLFSMCVQTARKEGVVEPGSMVVITAGVPIGQAGSTNLIKAELA